MDKRERKHNAIQLPIEIKPDAIPKYVVYYKECYNLEKKMYRDYFKIENHPLNPTNKVMTSSKSTKIDILAKLEQIKRMLDALVKEKKEEKEEDQAQQTEDKEPYLPKYVTIKPHEDPNKYYLVYDKRSVLSKRQTIQIICDNKESKEANLERFRAMIKEKFLISPLLSQ